jgi:hypothetical protein
MRCRRWGMRGFRRSAWGGFATERNCFQDFIGVLNFC